MRQDFFPDRESAVPAWSKNFRDKILEMGEALGLDPEQCEQYSLLHEGFVDAYRVARDPSTRTKPVVSRKDDALRLLEADARRLSRLLQASPVITEADRVSLGLSARRGGGKQPRVGRPESPPHLHIVSTGSRSVRIRLGDRDTIGRGRPRGVIRAVILLAFAEEAPTHVSQWQVHDLTPLTRYVVRFAGDVPVGTTVWISAQWLSSTLDRGPGAAAVCAAVPAGLAMHGHGVRTEARAA